MWKASRSWTSKSQDKHYELRYCCDKSRKLERFKELIAYHMTESKAEESDITGIIEHLGKCHTRG